MVMYLFPHREALSLVEDTKKEDIQSHHIFELGYLRPNFVTLENKGINYNSSLLKSREFYLEQDSYEFFPIPKNMHVLELEKYGKQFPL